MAASVEDLVGRIIAALHNGDPDGALKTAQILDARLKNPLSVAAKVGKVLYDRLNEWSDIKDGTVNTLQLVDVLREEGWLA